MPSPIGPVPPARVAGVVGRLRLACDWCPRRATLAMASVTCPGCAFRMTALLCDTCYFWDVRGNTTGPEACCDTCGTTVSRTMIGSVDFIINL